jgi:hypothetical protein
MIALIAGNFDQINDLAIDHLFPSMFKIDRHVHADNGLHLARSPIGLVWMGNKITKAEIQHHSLTHITASPVIMTGHVLITAAQTVPTVP